MQLDDWMTGIVVLLLLLLVTAISPASNWREQMDVPGIVGLFSMLLKVAISSASNNRERMDATGKVIHLKELKYAATKMCSVTLSMKGPLPGRLYYRNPKF